MLRDVPGGGYRFLPGIEPYSSGAVALPGHAIVHVTLCAPVPWRDGFALVDRHLRAESRPRTALCAIALRIPKPLSFDGFAEFNAGYREQLVAWGLLVDGANPIARTNVAPLVGAPLSPSLYAFAYVPPGSIPHRWSLLALLTSAYGLGAFGMLGVSPLSPALMQGFALSRFEVAFIVPSVYVGGLLFSLPGGHLADQWGVRPTLLGALALGGIGLLAAALAPHFVVFLLCLVIAGSGWSIVNPVLGKAIVDL